MTLSFLKSLDFLFWRLFFILGFIVFFVFFMISFKLYVFVSNIMRGVCLFGICCRVYVVFLCNWFRVVLVRFFYWKVFFVFFVIVFMGKRLWDWYKYFVFFLLVLVFMDFCLVVRWFFRCCYFFMLMSWFFILGGSLIFFYLFAWI